MYSIELLCRTNISRIKFSWLVKKPRNQRKFSPSKNLGYTVYVLLAIHTHQLYTFNESLTPLWISYNYNYADYGYI